MLVLLLEQYELLAEMLNKHKPPQEEVEGVIQQYNDVSTAACTYIRTSGGWHTPITCYCTHVWELHLHRTCAHLQHHKDVTHMGSAVCIEQTQTQWTKCTCIRMYSMHAPVRVLIAHLCMQHTYRTLHTMSYILYIRIHNYRYSMYVHAYELTCTYTVHTIHERTYMYMYVYVCTYCTVTCSIDGVHIHVCMYIHTYVHA